MEPLLGLVSDYSSNPYLVPAGGRAASDVAVLVNAPTSYDLDAAHFTLTPSIRYSDSGSNYASLNSNYFHMSGSAAFSSDLNTLSLATVFGRDSSLYQNGLSSNGLGVRSDGGSATVDWQHTMTERCLLELDAGWNRELYSQNSASTGLVDYRYLSIEFVRDLRSQRTREISLLGGRRPVSGARRLHEEQELQSAARD